MQNKNPIIIIAVLSVMALGLGYWYGLPKEGADNGGGGGKEPDFLKQGLVAYYPFNGNAKDESGNGNDGKVISATLMADRHGKNTRSYGFDGKDDLIEIPPSQSINAMRSLSIALWVKADKTQPPKQDASGLVTRWDTSLVRDAFGIFLMSKGQVGAVTWPRKIRHDVLSSCSVGTWQHITFTHDKSRAVLYVNGKEQGSSNPLPSNLRESDLPIVIGADQGTQKGFHYRFFSGQIDDIRIYNRALSDAEVKELYEFEKAN